MTDEPETPPKRKSHQLSKGAKVHPEQYARFLEAARALGCEENTDRLNEVLRRVAKMPPPRQGPTKTGKGKKADQ